MRKVKKYIILIITSFILIAFFVQTKKSKGVTSCFTPLANGVLKLQVRNDSLKYICPEIKVQNGVFTACGKNQLINYDFFIKREKIDSNWLIDPIRLYNHFPKVDGTDSAEKWFIFENKSTHNYKEDFTATDQKLGVTYRHHESKKNIINYSIANPNQKAISDDTKFHFQCDWEENIKGKYESFYDDGSKRFRHKYLLSRLMVLDKKINSTEQQSNCNINLSGLIESYGKKGKKKEVVIYNDYYITEKETNKKRTSLKTKRSGQRKVFYDSGKLFYSGKISFKGFEGEVIYYSPKKIIIKTSNFKNGILHGKTEEFHNDGTNKLKGQYTLGIKSGEWELFDISGKKKSTTKY
tara:strand:+ start:1172 stop:2227 length:1056 start_codon:yes stop_codon:yes gene_type:complete